jgi:hypothetical protein
MELRDVNATVTCYFSQIRLNVIFPPALGTFECFSCFHVL